MTNGKKPQIFISAKMRGIPYYNFPEFDKARDRLARLGLEPLSPADMDRAIGFDPTKWTDTQRALAEEDSWNWVPSSFDLAAAIKRDNEAIGSASAVYVLHEGFADSEGATAEVALAMKLGKTLVYDTMSDEAILRAMGLYFEGVDRLLRISGGMREIVDKADAVMGVPKTFFTDPATGGRKETKLARFDLLPPDIMWELAEHYGRGAAKYGDRNMEKGYPFSKTYAACQRHLNQFWRGEDVDAETGSLHLIAAAWHCLTMAWFLRHGKGTDDRPSVQSQTREAPASN